MRKYLLDFVLIVIIGAILNALLVQVISPTATLMISPLVTLFAEILRKQAVVAFNCKLSVGRTFTKISGEPVQSCQWKDESVKGRSCYSILLMN